MPISPVHQQVHDLFRGRVYLVGGAVRDYLLGHELVDYDFATPLTPAEVEEIVRSSGRRPYLVGKRFGTVGFRVPASNGYQYIEVTTYRQESYTPGSRKPDVEFTTDLETDLSRRDFTINAMALGVDGTIHDPFGGQADLQAGVIRAVGNPKERFREDPLRILRAIRFAARYQFEVEAGTTKRIRSMRFELLNVSRERWVQELDKILAGPHVKRALHLLMELGLWTVLIPDLSLQQDYDQNSDYHDFTLFEHTARVVERVPAENLNLRWAALLHDLAKPFVPTPNKRGRTNYLHHDMLGASLAEDVCRRLKFSNERRQFVVETIRTHLQPDSLLKVYDDAGKKNPSE